MEERLSILRESGLITVDVYNKLEHMIEGYKNVYGIELTEENASMMITHLSQAMMRVLTGDEINEPDPMIVDELKNSEYYLKMEEMYKETCTMLDFEFPKDEKWFVFVHIGTLIITENIV